MFSKSVVHHMYNRGQTILVLHEIETLCGERARNQASVLPIDCFYKIS